MLYKYSPFIFIIVFDHKYTNITGILRVGLFTLLEYVTKPIMLFNDNIVLIQIYMCESMFSLQYITTYLKLVHITCSFPQMGTLSLD